MRLSGMRVCNDFCAVVVVGTCVYKWSVYCVACSCYFEECVCAHYVLQSCMLGNIVIVCVNEGADVYVFVLVGNILWSTEE